MFDILEADIVVFQETKIQRKDLKDDMVLVPGWDCFFSLPRVKKGEFFVIDLVDVTLMSFRVLGSGDLHAQCHLRAHPR